MSSLVKQKISLNFKDVEELKRILCQNSTNSLDSEDVPFLQRVKIATVPTFDVVVVANEKNFVVSTTIDDETNLGQSPLVQKTLDDFITSVACWPVAPSRLTDPRPYEWTALIFGLKNGVLHFYTDRGYFLMKQQFGRTKVVEIRVETDQLSILYDDCYVVVNGLTLLAALKTCRQKVARGESLDDDVNVVEIISQKYSLDGCSAPKSVASTGICKQTLWDQMTTASNTGGFNARLGNVGSLSSSSSPNQVPYDTYCAVGQDSFVSFNWYADSLRTSDFISETFHSVTNRFKSSFGLTSMLTGWGSSSTSATKKQNFNIDQLKIIKVPQRSALYDATRKSEQITVSPNGRLAAVADSHARVILLDVRRRLALRVWKGYRDAQCGWFEIGGRKEKSKNSCKILCLVIFAPKRGILEVWAAQNGRRIAAFNVDKDGLLLYCPPTSSAHTNPWSVDHWKPLRFVDSSGHFHIPSVSFEVAIDKRSTSTYWTAEMIESFRSWWSSVSVDDVADDAKTLSKLGSIISSINATKDLRYLVEIIMKTKNLTYRLAAKFIETILNRLNELSGDDEKQKSAENLVFYNYCTSLKQCVNFYAVVTKLSLEKNIYKNQESSDELTSMSVAEILFVEEEFLISLCQDLDDNLLIRDSNQSTNEFDKSVINLSSFLSYVDVTPSHCQTSTDVDDGPTLAVRLSAKLTDEELSRFGDFLFTPFLTNFNSKKFEREFRPLFGLNVDDWILLLCRFWLNGRRSYSVHPQRLYDLFLAIFSACGDDEFVGNYLTKARDILMNSHRTAECVCLCLVLRAVAKRTQPTGDDWEKIEFNIESWDVLMKILHGLLLLDTFSRQLCASSSGVECQTSINDILSVGYGFPAEELAKRFVDCKNADELTPTVLIKAFNRVDADDDNLPPALIKSKESLEKLKEIFPSSLFTVAVAANCCWENVRRWFSNVGDVSPLNRSVEFLNLVKNIFVRRGLAALIWQKFLCGYVEQLCLILEDCSNGGEDIDERFWLKTKIPGRNLLTFVESTMNICRVLYDVSSAVDDDESASWIRSNFEVEDFMREFFDAFAKHAPRRSALTSVSADQPAIDKRKGRVHYVLSIILTMIVQQQGALSESSPFLLFSEPEEEMLFERLHSDPASDDAHVGSGDDEETYDKRLQLRRITFLKSWISAVLSQNSVDPNFQHAFDLAQLWSLNADEIRRHQVYQLFATNHADVASRFLHLVEDRRLLAKDLMDLVCKSLCVQFLRTKVKPATTSRLDAYMSTFKDVTVKSNKALSLTNQTCRTIMLFVSGAFPRKSEPFAVAKDLRSVIESLNSDVL